ncbi:AAA family ATPase, partial [Piscinibacter sp.]|uniref:AAA family ATPase n=1 Tax=Piscinibacter sp. TaxID=1903157 RepID=UPI002D0A194A
MARQQPPASDLPALRPAARPAVLAPRRARQRHAVEAQQTFAAALRPVFGEAADEHTALLGQLIGLDYSASPFIAGILRDGKQLQGRGLNAWVRCLQFQAVEQPLVLVLDDLHWADDESLNALDHLVAVAPELPVLLLCAARPELLQRRPQWGEHWPGHAL